MTQRELDNLIEQINQAFKTHFDKLEKMEERLVALEGQMSGFVQQEKSNAKGEGSKAEAGRGKRVQQAKENSGTSD